MVAQDVAKTDKNFVVDVFKYGFFCKKMKIQCSKVSSSQTYEDRFMTKPSKYNDFFRTIVCCTTFGVTTEDGAADVEAMADNFTAQR